MKELRKFKVSKQIQKIIEQNAERLSNSSEMLSKEEAKQILNRFGFKENDNVELNDFFQFSKYFGCDKDRYILLKPLKDEAEVNWQDIANIKYGDIDFKNNTISFLNQVVKQSKRKVLDR